MNFQNIFFSSRDDWLIKKIDQIFFTDNIISQSMGIFNIVFFYLFIFLMMVMVVSAVVNSAAQGRAFGKGSEVWVVMRVMMSLILILPAGSHTYNFAQILAINCIKVGSRGATYAWEKALQQMKEMKPLVPPSSPKVSDLAHQLFSMAICREVQNHRDAAPPRVTEHLHRYTDRYVVSADGDPSQGGVTGQCGTITYLTGDVKNAAVRQILDQHIALTNTLRSQINKIAENLVRVWFARKPSGTLPSYDLNSIFEHYTHEVARLAPDNPTADRNQRRIFFEESRKGGWAFAGAWAYQLAAVNQAVYSALETLPAVTPPRYEWWAGNSKLYHHPKWVFAAAERWWEENEASTRHINKQAYAAFKEDSAFTFLDAARFKKFYKKFLVTDETLNPIDKMVSVGHAIINTAWAALAAKAGAEFALAMAKSAADNTFLGRAANFLTGLPSGATNGAKAIANTYGPLFYLGLFSLISSGIMLAYFLPLLPFRLWIFGIARYVMRAMMAILAAPLWAIAHLEVEGSGFGRRASHGYYVLLDLLLRPLIMVIGLLAGFAVIAVLAELFSMTFHIAIQNALAGSHGGVTGLVVYILFGAILFISLVNIAFSTISDGIDFIFETGGIRTPQGGGSPERDVQVSEKGSDHSSQKVEGLMQQGASSPSAPSKPVSNNQLIKPEKTK